MLYTFLSYLDLGVEWYIFNLVHLFFQVVPKAKLIPMNIKEITLYGAETFICDVSLLLRRTQMKIRSLYFEDRTALTYFLIQKYFVSNCYCL